MERLLNEVNYVIKVNDIYNTIFYKYNMKII